MKKQKIDSLMFDANGDLMSIEAFICFPEALAFEEQLALRMLDDMLLRLQQQSNFCHIDDH